MTGPAFSIVITAYNQAGCLEAAVGSALGQGDEGIEVIVADDASTDATPDLIRDLEARHPGRVRGVLADRNQGVAANRNAGLAAARGAFVTWLDGDDVFLPGKLTRERAALQARPGAAWAYSQVRVVPAGGGEARMRYDAAPEGDVLDAVAGMMGQAPRNPLVAAEALAAVGPFDARMGLYEDFDLVLRLARRFPCTYCPEPGMEYHLHPHGLHAADLGRHVHNFALLRDNFLALTEDLPAPRRGRVRRRLLHAGELLLLGDTLATGDRVGAARHLLRSIALKPASLFRRTTLRSAATVLAGRMGEGTG